MNSNKLMLHYLRQIAAYLWEHNQITILSTSETTVTYKIAIIFTVQVTVITLLYEVYCIIDELFYTV